MNKENLIIDYIENELPTSLVRDVEILLKHSGKEREDIESYKKIKNLIKENQNPLENKDYFTDMHDKIMKQVLQKNVRPPERSKVLSNKNIKTFLKWGNGALVLMLAISVFDFSSLEHVKKELPNQMVKLIKNKSSKKIELSHSVQSYMLEDDLVIELAQNKMQNSSAEENNEVVNYLMN